MLNFRPLDTIRKIHLYFQKKTFEHVWHHQEQKHHAEHSRKISILLTRFPDRGSRIISLLTGFYYTHASIGLPEEQDTYYSFVRKGFIVEKASRYIRPNWEPLPCQLYEIPVSEETYHHIKNLLHSFVERKPSLQYSNLGVFLSLCRIRHKRQDRYFCSQFVAEILKETRAAHLKKDPSLCMPKDLSRLPSNNLIFQGTLPEMIHSFGIHIKTT